LWLTALAAAERAIEAALPQKALSPQEAGAARGKLEDDRTWLRAVARRVR
jgi:hypothetical protein